MSGFRAMILLHFLPQMRSKDLRQNEHHTSIMGDSKKYVSKFLRVLVFHRMLANPEWGNLDILTPGGMYTGPMSGLFQVPYRQENEGSTWKSMAAYSLPDTDKAVLANNTV